MHTPVGRAHLPPLTRLPPPRPACSDIVPLGQLKSSFNYSTQDKRVLNAENIVNDDDNIKQARGWHAGHGSCPTPSGAADPPGIQALLPRERNKPRAGRQRRHARC